MNQLSEAARETARRASEGAQDISKKAASATSDFGNAVEGIAGDIIDATKNAAKGTADSAKDIYRSATVKVEDTLETSRMYVRQNPLPVVIGAIALGAAVGCLLTVLGRKPTFSERYAEGPLDAVREAVISALSPVAQRVHEGYDSARDGAGIAIDRMSNIGAKRSPIARQIGRIGNNLRFW